MASFDVLTKEILALVQKKDQTFTLAESCTAGLLSASFAGHSGLSKNYLGGVVSYSNFSKQVYLDVSSEDLETKGAVSEEVARQMAKGAQKKLESDWALSVTGIAGPDGGSKDKPVGLVFFAIVGPNIERVYHQNFSGAREEIQKQSIDFILRTFLKTLKEQ